MYGCPNVWGNKGLRCKPLNKQNSEFRLISPESDIFHNIFKMSHLEGAVILTNTTSLTPKATTAIFRIAGNWKNSLKQKIFVHEKAKLWAMKPVLH